MSYDFLKNMSDKNKTLIIVSVNLIVVLYLSNLIYNSAYNIKIINQQIEKFKVEITEIVRQDDPRDSLSLYKEYQKKIKTLNNSILSKNRELEFITSLENSAVENNVEQKINLSDFTAVEGKPYFQMPMQLLLKGEFNDELRYLQEIEKLNYYVNIEKINISKAGANESGKSELSMFILANTIWQ